MKNFLLLVFSTICIVSLSAQTIYGGQSLQKDRKYYSKNREFYLIFQNDGNLVMYNKINAPVWASKTDNKGARTEFQKDGNLVVYNNSAVAVFSTGTNNKGNSLVVQDDGNLVIYNVRNNAVWASKDHAESQSGNYNTGIVYKDKTIEKDARIYSENGDYFLTFQQDGNLVLYYKNTRSPLWASNTAGSGQRAIFQADGNLVVYDRLNKAVFSTNTNNKSVDRLTVQNDGNLVIYNFSGTPLWAVK